MPRIATQGVQPTTAVDVVIDPTSVDWPDRNARGEVPGRWPYGLDGLAAPGRPVSLVPMAPLARGEAARRLLRPRPDGAVGLAWNENLAHRMVQGRGHAEMHCGVIWATDVWDDLPARSRAGLRRTLARMTSVWTLSRAQLDRLDGLVPEATARHFVPFGIDEEFFTPAPYPERPLLVSVGGDRDRDQTTVLEAFEIVRRARPETEAVVQSARDIGGSATVRIVERLSHVELRDLYRRASVVAVATRPNLHVSGMTVSLEAQATARPVVLTRTPGMEDYVADGTTGLLVPVGSAQQMAERIIGLLDDPGTAAQMGHAGRGAVEASYTSRHLTDRLRSALQLT